MVTKINPTPTLYGEDAKKFLEKMNIPSTKEEKESLKKADEIFKKVKYIHRVLDIL